MLYHKVESFYTVFCLLYKSQENKHFHLQLSFKRVLAYLWLMLFFVNESAAQKKDLFFEHITVEKGLSQSTVFAIAQDKLGFMWFGTKDGLNRYDSRQIEVFKHSPNDTTSLSSNININTLLVDSKGNLWVGTQNGLNKYYPETNSFQRFSHHPQKQNTLSNNTIRCIYEDKEGTIWIGTDYGLNKLLPNGTFLRIPIANGKKEGVAHHVVKAVYQDKSNIIWVGTLSGLTAINKVNDENSYTSFFSEESNSSTISGDNISSIIEDNNQNLWIGTRLSGLNLFDRESKTFTRFKVGGNSLSSNDIRKLIVGPQGNLWIATLQGINIYNPVTRKFSVYMNEPENPFSLNQNSIYDLYEDASGSIWIGTYYGGVNICHHTKMPFKTYQHFSYKNSLSSNVVSAIVEDTRANLWIATEAEGINYYNRETGIFKQFKYQPGSGSSLSSNLIKSLAFDDKGRLWIAAYEGGIDVYNPTTGKFKNYQKQSNRFSYLLHDSQKRMWIGTRGGGLYLYDKVADDLRALNFPATFIYYLFEDADKTIWIASNEGIFYLKHGKHQFVRLSLKSNPSIFQTINCIQQDGKGNLWFGSLNEGLVAYNQQLNQIKIYTSNQGLPSDNITAIVESDDKVLWVSTTRGLAKFINGAFKSYSKEDGLPGNVFNHNSFYKDKNGVLFFGGYNGMVSFNPADLPDNLNIPRIAFTKLKLFNKTVSVNDSTGILKQSITTSNKIELSYNQNVFSIDFSVLNYIKPEKNKFAYKIEGIDKQWIYTDVPSVSFNNLSDGEYTLLVKGANNDGLWNNQAASLKIKINPPFWKSWWAYLLYLTVLGAIILVVTRYFFLQALLKKEHDVNQQKLDFFTHVSHEIRTPLTLIAGPIETLIRDTSDNKFINQQLQGVNKNVKRLLRLINELMDFRKIESGMMQLKLERTDLKNFVYEIYNSFDSIAQRQHINYEFSCLEERIELYLDRNQLEKVIFNLLSNAFKFVPNGGNVVVEVLNEGNLVKVKVSDSGPGIPKESRDKLFTDFYQAVNNQTRNAGTGIGLALAKSIALLHDGNLTLEEETKNTTFTLTLPGENSGLLKKHKTQSNTELETIDEVIEQDFDIDEIEEQASQSENLEGIDEEITTILIVDDNEEIRSLIESIFSNKHYVLKAENGIEGLKIATEKIPDIIISDVMMPEMDGYQLCESLKLDERTSHIPVILLTAKTGETQEIQGLKTGADVYITKPFNVSKLQYSVENLLALKESMRIKFSQQLTLEPLNIVIESSDEEFLQKVLALLEKNINNTDFNVNQFAFEIGMSTPIFYKKIKALTGMTVNNFMKSFRLKRAAQLLEQNAGTVYEISYMVGFNDAKYFSKEFKKQFGKSPTEYSPK